MELLAEGVDPTRENTLGVGLTERAAGSVERGDEVDRQPLTRERAERLRKQLRREVEPLALDRSHS
jgi:hypothetical protein